MHYIYFILFEIIMIITVQWALASYVNNFAQNTHIEKTYISKDISSLMNTLYSAPGDVFYRYNLGPKINLSDFDFDFVNNKVTIKDLKSSPVYSYFGINKDLNFNIEDINDQNSIYFLKRGDQIYNTPSSAEEVYDIKKEFKCPNINTTDNDWLDTKKYFDESDTLIMDNFLFADNGNFIRFDSRDAFLRKINLIENQDSALLIIIKQIDSQDKKIKIKMSYESNERVKSRKLGCILANNLINNPRDLEPVLFPLTPSDFSEDQKEHLLIVNKPAILIEFSGLMHGDDKLDIGRALYYAIETYFE